MNQNIAKTGSTPKGTPAAERAWLVAVSWAVRGKDHDSARREADDHLDELERLAESAGAFVLGRDMQVRNRRDPALLLGKGKVEELAAKVQEVDADLVIFDEELTPAQQRNLEEALQRKVVDRTGLILDIFARRAQTREGKMQVELAQLEYLLPRLVGRWGHFSRQVAGIGMRGPGETQLEIDRRLVRQRIGELRDRLKSVVRGREVRRRQRERKQQRVVSLVGYTNAGKSTLMNALVGAKEYADDLLFATLDPVTRRFPLSSLGEVLLTDTVGFVQKLPHQLVAAFRATFEEIQDSDLLLHVVDASALQLDAQMAEVERVLTSYDLNHLPRITVYNKMDRLAAHQRPHVAPETAHFVSALTGEGIQNLRDGIAKALMAEWPEIRVRLPFTDGKMRSRFYAEGVVLGEQRDEWGIELTVRLPPHRVPAFREFLSEQDLDLDRTLRRHNNP